MRRVIVVATTAALAIGVHMGSSACGSRASGKPSAPAATVQSTTAPAEPSDRAAIYAAMLRRYLTSSDHSFGDHRFPIAYVLDRATASAAVPMPPSTPPREEPISIDDQAAVVAALADVARVQFIADRTTVIEDIDRCHQVRDGGILITLGPPVAVAQHMEVAIHGFVACLGATWFTYVAARDGAGWQVTGTTGPMAIA